MEPEPAPSRRSPSTERALEVLDLADRATAAYGRPDLGERVAAARRRLLDAELTVVVAGEFKQGKSSLVNALLAVDLLPVDVDETTSVPTFVRHGPEPAAAVVRSDGDGPRIEPIDLDDLGRWAAGDGDDPDVTAVELRVPRRMLESGVVVVDTPGVGGLGSAAAAATLGVLALADALVFVTDASQELTESERDFLRRALDGVPVAVCAVTKTDLYPRWRDIVELDRRHLVAAGLDLPVVPVSAELRRQAIADGDADRNVRSGLPDLVGALADGLLSDPDRRRAASAAAEVVAVCDRLQAQLEAERAVLDRPEQAADTLAHLEAARARAEELRAGSARWQVELADAVGNLSSDLDHDLRRRLREVHARADARIDGIDPAVGWSEFEAELRADVAREVTTNHLLLVERADQIADRLTALFAAARAEVGLEVTAEPFAAALDAAEDGIELGAGERRGLVASGLGILRGSYGGMMMFGMLGGLFGVTLVAPVVVGVGLALGARQLREDRRRELQQRRQLARQSVRRYLDDVTLASSKDSRDALRRVQRQLRDHYQERARDLVESAQAALRAAEEAARADADGQRRRVADLDAELGRVAALRTRAAEVTGS